MNRGYMTWVLRLMLLAPDLVEAILDGRQSEGMRLEDLLDGVPVEWDEQREHVGARQKSFLADVRDEDPHKWR